MSSYSNYSDSSCGSDTESVSSSVYYAEQEPFVTFRNRVLDLALHKIWPDATVDEITIERMMGGGFNRIIGISRHSAQQPDNYVQYILRVPRFSDEPLDSQVGTLHFLQKHYSIPVPKVINFDHTDNNELNSRYMIQNRVPGEILLSAYPKLTHEERCKLAQELGHLYSQMLATTSATSTILVPPEKEDIRDPPLPQDIHKMLDVIFKDQKAAELKVRPNSIIQPSLLDQFCEMAAELKDYGWFDDCHISLAHLDLEPRNILVNPTSDASSPVISAILDWDSAVFAPQFMCCEPPLWLWAWQDEEEEDERTGNEEPPTPEGRELKQLFEEAAGPDYVRFAYKPCYRLMRELVHFAIRGLCSNEDYKEARKMLQEWEELYHDESSTYVDSEEDKFSDTSSGITSVEDEGSIDIKAEKGYFTIQNYSTTAWSGEGVIIQQDESTGAWVDW
ncbi:kinase-like domain-containing protein [Daldinia caldariorum]|uniref:kinase-like domain-containing protein n=1 Tax=Daldinia caldariorum TaxID=326644 RepID=UPI00200776D0|nr:kinase-like domain-containing protein [Daldinia caldariorum]KAI1471592.1 kinase-like domain-containing protein [Daldinia caldariorum]